MTSSATFYVRVSATVVEILGLLLTVWRIYFRLKIGRFGWEDTWAAILLGTSVVWIVACWVYIKTTGLISIVADWCNSMGFTSIVTLARMSVLFSIIRIIHGRPHLLQLTYACAAFFAACWIILIIQKIVQCGSDSSWHQVYTFGAASCLVGPEISIFEFITDCIAVSVLVVIPLHMLWRVKLPRRQKRMILSIFASSVFLAFASLFHSLAQRLNIPILMTASMHAEVALSIILCNLLVVVTYACRFLLRGGESEITSTDTSDDDDFTTQARVTTAAESTLPLTTVDINVPFTASVSSPETSIKTGSV